jgi:hypothetical protein
MTKKTTQKPRPPNYHLTLTFEHQARRLPPADRPSLLTHLRRLRCHPHRTFYLIDELGRRHRL